MSAGSLLEVGCGTGEFLLTARRAGWQAEGLELSQSFREAAKAWYNLDVGSDELFDEHASRGDQFDAVVLLHVFEHLADPLVFLNKMQRITKPGGWLFIVVPNARSWTDALFGGSNPTLAKRDHFFHYDRTAIQLMISRSKFEVLAATTFEPEHHFWTSLYGFLSSAKQTVADRSRALKRQPAVSMLRDIKSNAPYWMGTATALFSFPMRRWLDRRDRGHEIYVLCRRKQTCREDE